MADIVVWIGNAGIVGTDFAFEYNVVTDDGDLDTKTATVAMAQTNDQINAAILAHARAHCAAEFGTTAGEDTLLGGLAPDVTWSLVKKTSDTERASDAVVSDDPDLVFTAASDGVYLIRLRVWFATNSTADFKYRLVFTGTADTVMRSILRGAGGEVPAQTVIGNAFDAADVSLTGTGSRGIVFEEIRLDVAAAGAGDLKFQWAQNTSFATPAYVLLGSHIEYHRVV